jgi:hypothetical protein
MRVKLFFFNTTEQWTLRIYVGTHILQSEGCYLCLHITEYRPLYAVHPFRVINVKRDYVSDMIILAL